MASKKNASKYESVLENAADVKNTAASNLVTVLCNLPGGISFVLPNMKRITFNGYPVSKLVGAEGEILPAGKYGVTEGVDREAWDWIKKTYAKCDFFKPGHELLIAVDKPAEARAMLEDRKDVRHGMEQVDPETLQTKAEGK